jgi:hypothetical protein
MIAFMAVPCRPMSILICSFDRRGTSAHGQERRQLQPELQPPGRASGTPRVGSAASGRRAGGTFPFTAEALAAPWDSGPTPQLLQRRVGSEPPRHSERPRHREHNGLAQLVARSWRVPSTADGRTPLGGTRGSVPFRRQLRHRPVLTGLPQGLADRRGGDRRNVVLHLTSERDESGIVRAGTDLGPDRGLRVVAEGVADAADEPARSAAGRLGMRCAAALSHQPTAAGAARAGPADSSGAPSDRA